MITTETCYILPSDHTRRAFRADDHQISFSWGSRVGEILSERGAEVAPGVTVALLSIGQHWVPGEGKFVEGALIAVRTVER